MSKTLFSAISIFLATLSFLAFQVGAGHDPALNGPATALVSSTSGPGAVQTRSSGGSGHASGANAHRRHGPQPARTASSGGRHGGTESD